MLKTGMPSKELSVLWSADQGSINDHDSSLVVAIIEQRLKQRRENLMRLLLKRAPCKQMRSATLHTAMRKQQLAYALQLHIKCCSK